MGQKSAIQNGEKAYFLPYAILVERCLDPVQEGERSDDLVLNGVFHHPGGILGLYLFQNVAPVCIYGAHADEKFFGNLNV